MRGTTITLKRGLEIDRTTFVPLAGEVIWCTDTKKVFIGDGVTPGGIEWPGFDGREPSLKWIEDGKGEGHFVLLADGKAVSATEQRPEHDLSWFERLRDRLCGVPS